MNQDYLDLAREVMDRQIVDSNNLPCGKVDEIEVTGGVGQLKIKALLVGGEARSGRLPSLLRMLVQKFFPSKTVRVPWSEVSIITHQIKLKSTARKLGLDRAERKAAALLTRLPGANL
jgi:sporulation protein YlmC with PRC-barrel domain